ncbi:MAG: hypothetical protein FWG08_04340 [Propionibacteriaceae bacterium]|nr:hypothetical protein [Propionibacteriaceae bacterium]
MVPWIVIAAGDVHNVCEHGMVVGRAKRRYVIPWATIDPGRVFVVKNMGHPSINVGVPHVRNL